MTWQLRSYRVKEGQLDALLRAWHDDVKPLRAQMGFEVLGPCFSREERRFVWLVGHEDFATNERAYYASPERAAFDPDPGSLLDEVETSMLEDA